MEFRPGELVGALIVDSEGYTYGHAVKVDVGPDGLIFKVKSVKSVQTSVPDIDTLKQDLIRDLKEKFTVSDGRELFEFVAKELKIQSVTENDLVSYARLRDIKIPMKDTSREVEEEKLDIHLKDTEAMNKSELGSCILLKIPIEARMKGMEPREIVSYQSEDSLKGKFVVDNTARILGKVHSLLMSAEGMSIKLGKEGMVTKLIPDINSLKKRIFSEKAQREVVKEIESLGFEQPENLTNDKLLAYAKIRGYEIPTRLDTSKTLLLYKSSVPWRQIRKIGDVVLLNKTIPELFEEESKPEGFHTKNLFKSSVRSGVQRREATIPFLTTQGSLTTGVFIGTFLMIFIGLVSYIGALLSGAVAGYLARGWKRGAIAGLFSGLLGSVIMWMIFNVLFLIGFEDFLAIILPVSILDAAVNISRYATTEAFLYFGTLINLILGLFGGLFIGLFRSE